MNTKRTQIENRIADRNPHWTLARGYHHGVKVWYVRPERITDVNGQLTSGGNYVDYWQTLDDAHRAIFADQGVRADNY